MLRILSLSAFTGLSALSALAAPAKPNPEGAPVEAARGNRPDDVAAATAATCSDGTPLVEGDLVDGRPHGLWRIMQVVAEEPGPRCVCPESAGRYEYGVEVAEWTFYTRFEDEQVARMRADLCRRHGICGMPGCAATRVFFAYDPATGIQESHFSDGTLRSRGVFRGGRREGEHTSWFPSGRVQRRGHYRRGRAVGVWQVGLDDDNPREAVFFDGTTGWP